MRRRRQLIPFVVESDGSVGAPGTPVAHRVHRKCRSHTQGCCVQCMAETRVSVSWRCPRSTVADDAHEPSIIEGFHTEVRCVQSASKCFSRSRRTDSFAHHLSHTQPHRASTVGGSMSAEVNAGQGSEQHLSRTAGEGLEAVATEWA